MENVEIHEENVEILLNSDQNKYQSGETISGLVNIKLNGELDLSRVSIVLRSVSEVKWLDNQEGNYKEGYVFRDKEVYLNVVYEITDNVKKTKLTNGSHSIPFEFILPDDIPSSIDITHGFIKYWIEVNVNDASFDTQQYHHKKYIIVESPFRNGLQLSVSGGTGKDVGLLSSETGKVRMVRLDASVSKKGHISGDTIEVHCLVTNTTRVAVTPRAQFMELEIFMAKENHKITVSSSDAVIGEKVFAGQTRQQIISVSIPKDKPLSTKTRLITIKYFIHVTLEIPNLLDLNINLPIIITNECALDERCSSFL